MEENLEAMDIFTQDGVVLKRAPVTHAHEINTSGTLSLVEYLNTQGAKGIEWKPNYINNITVESELQDQEWAVVNTTQQRIRTLSECTVSSDTNHTIRLRITDLTGFQYSKNDHHITLFGKTIAEPYVFQFKPGHGDAFLSNLKAIAPSAPSPRDKHVSIFLELHPDTQSLHRSFTELELFTDNSSLFAWKFLKNFPNSPYVTTMEAFSKFSDIVPLVLRSPDELDRDTVNQLNRSLTSSIDDTSTPKTRDGGYEVVEHEVDDALKLPPRPVTPRFKMLTREQWIAFKDDQGRIRNQQELKKTIFKGGISPEIRAEVWKYLLNYFPYHYTNEQIGALHSEKVEEYFTMKNQWKTITQAQEYNFGDFRERKSLIEKDVNRTDRSLEFYAGDDNPHIQELYDILMTYVMYNFDLGYVQGMSDLLSPILCLMSNEVDAFWCFVGFMNKVYRNFDMDQAGMKVQLEQSHRLLRFVDPQLAKHLERHDSGNMFFCFRWLLVLFKREFTYSQIMYIWEVLWTDLPCKNFHLLICLAILDAERNNILESRHGFPEILRHINDLSGNIDYNVIIAEAEGIYHQIVNARHLTNEIREILGLELVIECNNDLITSSNASLSNADGSLSMLENSDASDNRRNSSSPERAVYRDKEIVYERGVNHSFL